MHEAGFKVSIVRSPADAAEDGGSDDAGDEVAEEIFERWLMASQCALSQVLLQWWSELEPAGEGAASELKVSEHETAVDLWRRLAEDVRQAARPMGDRDARAGPRFGILREAAAAARGLVTVRSLAAWCRYRVGSDFGVPHQPRLA